MPTNKPEAKAWKNPQEVTDREQALLHIQRAIAYYRSVNEPLAARLEQEKESAVVLTPPEGSTHPLTAVVFFGFSEISFTTIPNNDDSRYIKITFTSPESEAAGFISHTLTIRVDPRSLYFGMRNTGSDSQEVFLIPSSCDQAGITDHHDNDSTSGSIFPELHLSPSLENPPADSGNYEIKQATLVDFAPWLAEKIRQEKIVTSGPATALVVEALESSS